jgi:hypothetical protein
MKRARGRGEGCHKRAPIAAPGVIAGRTAGPRLSAPAIKGGEGRSWCPPLVLHRRLSHAATFFLHLQFSGGSHDDGRARMTARLTQTHCLQGSATAAHVARGIKFQRLGLLGPSQPIPLYGHQRRGGRGPS